MLKKIILICLLSLTRLNLGNYEVELILEKNKPVLFVFGKDTDLAGAKIETKNSALIQDILNTYMIYSLVECDDVVKIKLSKKK